MSGSNWKILMVVLSTVNPDVRVEKEARYLASQGHELTVIGIDRTGDLEKREHRDGYTIIRLPSKKRAIFKYWEFWRKVKKYVDKVSVKYDFIHLHDLNVLPLVSKLKKKGKFFIYDSHENFPEQMSETYGVIALWVYTLLEKFYIHKVDHVITPGPSYSKNLEKKYGVKCDYIANYPSLVDVKQAHDQEIPEKFRKQEQFRIVYFGVMYHNLGYNKVVEAANILREKYSSNEIHFLIIGSGSSYLPMKQKINELDLSNYFRLTGWMDYHKALSVMRTADVGLILFQPGKNNYLRIPNRLYEYFSAGVLFIGSDFEGLKIGTEGHENLGLLIDPTSSMELAKTIERIYHRENLEELKKEAQTAFFEHYNWEKEIPKIEEIYEACWKKK